MALDASDILDSIRNGIVHLSIVKQLMLESDGKSVNGAPPAHFDQHVVSPDNDMTNLQDDYLDRTAHSLFASKAMAEVGVQAALSSLAGRYALKTFRDDASLASAAITANCSPGQVEMRVKTILAGMNVMTEYGAASVCIVLRRDSTQNRIHLQTAFPVDPESGSFAKDAPIGTASCAELLFVANGKRSGQMAYFNATTRVGQADSSTDQSLPGWWSAILSGKKPV